MLPDAEVNLLPFSPNEPATWKEFLALRPQFDAGHNPSCLGTTITLHAHWDSFSTCRDWLAGFLRVDREVEAEERRRGA